MTIRNRTETFSTIRKQVLKIKEWGKEQITNRRPNIKRRHKTKFSELNSPNKRSRPYQIGLTRESVCFSKTIPVSDWNDFGVC